MSSSRRLFSRLFCALLLGLLPQLCRASLVTWYKFDEGTGTTATDSSGNGGHLSANGTVAWNTKTGARFGGSAYFNGSTFRASRYNGASIQPQTIDLLRARTANKVTIAFWANPDTALQASTAPFGAVQGASTRILQSHLYLDASRNLYWDVGNSGNTYYRLNASVPPTVYSGAANIWTHWVFSFDASSPLPLKVYRNGSLEYAASAGVAGNINWAVIDTFDISGAQGLAATWKGAFDDFAIWDEAFTDMQIETLYDKGVAGFIQPVIRSFTASPGNLSTGQPSTLSWQVDSALAVSLNQGIGTVASSGTRIVNPTTTTTYTITATRGALTATDSTTLVFGQPEPDFVLNEILADNSNGLVDEDGDKPDWIEIYNPSLHDRSLAGWKLRNGLRTWTFPNKIIPGLGYLVVFASDKNRIDPASTLHTNFKLSKSGDTLDFLRPDSTTTTSLVFPAQKANIAYGTATTTTGVMPLISTPQANTLRYLVPSAAIADWTNPSFNDSAWTAGADTSIGFDSDLSGPTSFVTHFVVNLGTPTTGVPHVMWQVNPTLYTRYTFNVADKSAMTALNLKLKYEDGFVAWLNGVEIARGNFTGTPAYNSGTGTSRASENLSLAYDSFDITSLGLPALVSGTNVLAIQGMNFNASSSDFLLAPLLEASTTGTVGVYLTPTPGAVNGANFTGYVADTKFSVARGLYTTAQTVAITTTTPGATIRYTTNGTLPTATTGTVYTAPISVTTTTVIRAAAFKTGFVPTDVDTYSYVFPAATATALQSSASITAADIPNLVPGLTDLPTLSFSLPSTTVFTNDFKTPLSVEWLNPDGTPGFQIDCGADYFGGTFTNFTKKSFRLHFSSDYGASKLDYPVFAGFERGRSPPTSFDSLEIRNGSHDMASRGFYMSNIFADDTLADMGRIAPHGRFIHLYLNGSYWGVYHLRERWDAKMLSHYLGGKDTDYESINGNLNVGGWAEPGVPNQGDGSIWQSIKTNRSDFNAVKPYLDAPNFVDFMVLWMQGNSEHEFRSVGANRPGPGMMFIQNDADGFLNATTNVWDSNADNTNYSNPANRTQPGDGPGGVFSALFIANNSDYRTLLADRIHAQMIRSGGVMTPAVARTRLTQRTAQIDRAMIAECARWAYLTTTNWRARATYTLDTWFPDRNTTVLAQYRTRGFYPAFEAPTFSQQGGTIASGATVTFTAPSGGSILYTTDGSDPRLPGGATNSKAITATSISITNNTLLKARAKSGSTWSAVNEAFFKTTTENVPTNHLAITELNYNPDGTSADEFIEFTNLGTHAINLRGLIVGGGISYTFPDNYDTLLAPGQRVLIVENQLAFETRYGLDLAIAGVYAGSLNNAGDTITLTLPATATPFLSLTFDDALGWPTGADGQGRTLVLANRTLGADLNNPANWQGSASTGGSPGAVDLSISLAANPSTGLPFNAQLAALDFPAGASLTFSKTSGPAWLSVSSSGALSGTPLLANAGANSFGLSITDGTTTLSSTLALTVNHTPAFSADPINLNATEDASFTGQLVATDANPADLLSFTKQSGPAWLIVSPTGALSGTPLNEHVGPNAFTVSVFDGTVTVTASLNISVANTNDAPAFAADPINLNATEDAPLTGQLPGFDPDSGDNLTYAKVSGPDWLSVTSSGALSGTPLNEHVGLNSFSVSVKDAANVTVTAALNITVANTNDAPVFASDPINLAATGGTAFIGQLSASDVDPGTTLSFSKQSGPAWLSVSTTGALSGTPANADAGLNAFTVSVGDSIATVTATLNITVTPSGPTLASFTTTYFSPVEQSDSLISGPAADPDGDGIPNLLEYAFGSDPRNPASTRLPQPALLEVTADKHIGLTYTRLKGATDLTFTPEFSPTPAQADFTASSFVQVSLVDNGDGTETITIRDSTPLIGDAPRFARLRVTQN